MEDDEPRRQPPSVLGRDLRTLSVADLETYIATMRDEIARVEAELVRRRDVRGAAEALFKKPGAGAGGEPG
jgi:uncharacterized small protein (DUF1192 family)